MFEDDDNRVMGLDKITPKQEEMEGMENFPENRLMGIQPDGGVPVPVQPQQQVVPQDVGDPFDQGRYQDVNLPDAPVSYGGGMTESLINDNEVPKSIREKFWFIFHKDNTLTFLDEDRKKSKLLNFDIMKIDILNSTPYYEYDFEKEMEFGLLRNVYETKLDRALGFKGGTNKNERIILQSQCSEARHINENGDGAVMKDGFFKRLLGRR